MVSDHLPKITICDAACVPVPTARREATNWNVRTPKDTNERWYSFENCIEVDATVRLNVTPAPNFKVIPVVTATMLTNLLTDEGTVRNSVSLPRLFFPSLPGRQTDPRKSAEDRKEAARALPLAGICFQTLPDLIATNRVGAHMRMQSNI